MQPVGRVGSIVVYSKEGHYIQGVFFKHCSNHLVAVHIVCCSIVQTTWLHSTLYVALKQNIFVGFYNSSNLLVASYIVCCSIVQTSWLRRTLYVVLNRKLLYKK